MTENSDKTVPLERPEQSKRSASAGLDAIALTAAVVGTDRAEVGPRLAAPVHLWEPPYCGDIGLEIRGDGTWWYQDSIIGRPALVALFASVLRKDADGQTYLVTPAEKVLVRVADAPFLGVDLTAEGEGENQVLTVSTNLGDRVAIGSHHPLRLGIEAGTGGLKPYILVRGQLEALLTRAMVHQLVQIALSGPGSQSDRRLGVWSGGIFCAIAPGD